MCPDEGVLQAYLDSELDKEMVLQIADHLKGCAACRERLHALEVLAGSVTAVLAHYSRETTSAEPPVRMSHISQHSYRSLPLTKTRRFVNMFQRNKWYFGAAASVLVLAVFLSWPPSRSIAAQFLNIFRMEKIQVVEFTPEDMAQLNELFAGDGQDGEVDIRNFGRFKVEHSPDTQLITEADSSQIESLSGLKLNLPATLAGQERRVITVERPPTITITPDVENVNKYLSNFSNMLLPPALAGHSIIINIPPLVRVQYGQNNTEFTIYAARDLIIEAPEGVDLAYLRQALLMLPILPENLRQQLAEINDWRYTLPIPEIQGMSAGEITVNNNQGVYFVDPADDRGPVILAWRQGDSWRAVSGLPLEEALLLAAEVK